MNFNRLWSDGKRLGYAARSIGKLIKGTLDYDSKQPKEEREQDTRRSEEALPESVTAVLKAVKMRRQKLLETPLSEREAKVREFYALYEDERLRKGSEVYPEPTENLDPLVVARICLHAAATAADQFEVLEKSAVGMHHTQYIDEFRLPEQYFLFTNPDERVDEVVELLPDTRHSAVEIIQAWLINAAHGTEIRPEMPPPPHPSLAHAKCSFFDTWMGTDLTYEDIGVASPPDERKIKVYLSGTQDDGIVQQIIPDFMAHAEVWIN